MCFFSLHLSSSSLIDCILSILTMSPFNYHSIVFDIWTKSIGKRAEAGNTARLFNNDCALLGHFICSDVEVHVRHSMDSIEFGVFFLHLLLHFWFLLEERHEHFVVTQLILKSKNVFNQLNASCSEGFHFFRQVQTWAVNSCCATFHVNCFFSSPRIYFYFLLSGALCWRVICTCQKRPQSHSWMDLL